MLLSRREVLFTLTAPLLPAPDGLRKDPRNPLFGEDRPWEVRFDNLYPNVLLDPERRRYRCWYSPFLIDPSASSTPRALRATVAYQPHDREMGVCYAESADGIRWEKPDLGLVEFQGSRRNNLVSRGPHGAGVFRDAHERDPRRRYKMIYAREGVGLATSVSPDGLHWGEETVHSEIQAVGDTHNNALWVPERNAYVAITRLWDKRARQRLVARTESPDFRHWTKAVEILRAEPGAPHRQTYAMTIFRYRGVYLGLLMILDTRTDTVACELTRSADTVTWERVRAGAPLLPLGPAGACDAGCIYAAAAPVARRDGIRFYYGASNAPHGGWRDGFLCLAHLTRADLERFLNNDNTV